MTDRGWAEVDHYLVDTLVGDQDADVFEANAAGGLPSIDVSPPQGKLLNLIARSIGARRVLEIGTLGGYSTLWLARAVGPEGRVITLEYEPRHAEVAAANLARKGVADQVEIRVGAALDTLPVLAEETPEPFDLVFIDADKPNNSHYLTWALRLTRPGSVIIVDNVVRAGGIADPDSDNEAVRASRAVLELIAAEPRLDGTALQLVGGKGWDGFAYALVTG